MISRLQLMLDKAPTIENWMIWPLVKYTLHAYDTTSIHTLTVINGEKFRGQYELKNLYTYILVKGKVITD